MPSFLLFVPLCLSSLCQSILRISKEWQISKCVWNGARMLVTRQKLREEGTLWGPWIFLPKHCSPHWFCFEKCHLSPKSLDCRVQVAFVHEKSSNFPNVQKSSCKYYCLPSLAFNEEMLSRNTSFVLLMGKNINQTLAHACSPRIINLRPSQTPEKFQVQPELSWHCLQKSGAGCIDDRALAQHHKSEPSFPAFWHKVNVANFNFLLNTRFLVLVLFSHLFKCCFLVFNGGSQTQIFEHFGQLIYPDS